jgi:hypothetical protein
MGAPLKVMMRLVKLIGNCFFTLIFSAYFIRNDIMNNLYLIVNNLFYLFFPILESKCGMDSPHSETVSQSKEYLLVEFQSEILITFGNEALGVSPSCTFDL